MKVEFRNVTGTKGSFRLTSINLEIREGYLTGLVGKNGAGKTTLFHYLLDRDITFDGEILIDDDSEALAQGGVRNRFGFVSDEQKFFMQKTAGENARLLGSLYDVFSFDVFREHMKQMNVSTSRLLSKMSRGEYLKFQLAFAMAHETKLYLLDEVTAGMDPVFRKEFFRMLHEVLQSEDTAILMSTHIEEEITRHMDYVAVLEKGAVVSYGEVSEKGAVVSYGEGSGKEFEKGQGV